MPGGDGGDIEIRENTSLGDKGGAKSRRDSWESDKEE
jgi:hypothetical protein